ncbi:transcription factor FAMA-like isoform X2 [Phragmites australis]|uniref:transcription factor FAMA-like isoform X2 n=1 Tax=Phragmites australis TaxID=29695 RepID=UPI002D79DBD4|nr:transcription factor FAMA-like isoform X2 [Phragmites australis]
MHACVRRDLIMDKEGKSHSHLDSFAPLDGAPEEQPGGGAEMVDYMLGHAPPPNGPQSQVSLDKLSFSDVLQFADFGPRLALNQPAASDGREDVDDCDDDDDDDSYFFRFQSLPSLPTAPPRGDGQNHPEQEGSKTADEGGAHDVGGGVSESTTLVQQADGGGRSEKGGDQGKSGRRKRPRTVKTTEEVESQRMTHIAVERNRRRQMNEYLRILRSLMPGSYVQRGDQASIIGGAIEFIRELEQLIQCLESQKRRRLYGGSGDAPAPRPVVDSAGAGVPTSTQQQAPPPFFPPSLPFPAPSAGAAAKVLDLDAGGGGLREEVAENKSCLADIEVRALGADAMIKILSRRRPGQLIKTIAALEDMQMSILHTNITTIEQTVLYSFNVKIVGEARYSAEDIAGAVHQILSFIDVNYTL